MVDRFCSLILPKIHSNIRSLSLEASSMKRILLAAEYPHLTKLRIHNFDKAMVLPHLPDNCFFRCLYAKQITDLTLIADENIVAKTYEYCLVTEYAVLLLHFENLKQLTIVPPFINENSSFRPPPLSRTDFSSSTITRLSINVITLDDCLTLLDGRLSQLTSFTVQIHEVGQTMFPLPDRNGLTNLTCFSLTSYNRTEGYANRILPLLHRMSHLLELTLYLHAIRQSTIIDGTHLDNRILNHMPQLRTFTFYMSTKYADTDATVYLANEDVRRTFTTPIYPKVACMIDYYLRSQVICRVFSLPFQFTRFRDITNHFPDMIFVTVNHLTVKDKVGFRHEFFVRLARCFPSLKHLRICNVIPPFLKAHERHLLDGDWSSLVCYPHLISLDLEKAWNYYPEQFLDDTKTHLPRLIELRIPYDSLKSVTANFTSDATLRNCAKVKRLFVGHSTYSSRDVQRYFRSLAMAFSSPLI